MKHIPSIVGLSGLQHGGIGIMEKNMESVVRGLGSKSQVYRFHTTIMENHMKKTRNMTWKPNRGSCRVMLMSREQGREEHNMEATISDYTIRHGTAMRIFFFIPWQTVVLGLRVPPTPQP